MAANGHRSQKWRDLPPVDREVAVGIGEDGNPRAGVTFLRTHDRCDRAAFLSLLHEGGVGSHQMNRGSIFHSWAAKATAHLIEQGEQRLAPEVGKDLLLQTYDEHPEMTVPAKERDDLRAMVFNWCEGSFFHDPGQIVGVEQSVELRVETARGTWIVRGKIDRIEQPHFGRLDVTDYKTSYAMPTEQEWEGDYQTSLYALVLAFGTLDGVGISIGTDAQEFGLRLEFPRYLRDDGLASKFTTISRQQLLDLRLDLEHQLRRLEASLESMKWPATPGSHCAECPSPAECPLPRHLRPDSQMALASAEDAAKLAEWWYVTSERTKRAKARIKKWADENGRPMVPIGTDLALIFEHRESYPDLDREELFLEVEGAVSYGHEFDAEKYRTKKSSTRFEKRRVNN